MGGKQVVWHPQTKIYFDDYDEANEFARTVTLAVREMGFGSVSDFIRAVLTAIYHAAKNGGDGAEALLQAQQYVSLRRQRRRTLLQRIREVVR